MANPLDDYLGSKEAAAWQQMPLPGMAKMVGKDTLRDVGVGAAQAVGAIAVGAIPGVLMKTYQAISKKRQFNEMLDHNPDLQEKLDENPKMFHRQYSSLRSMNPTFASDPIVAGTYMRRMSENPTDAGGILAESLRSRPSSAEAEVRMGPPAGPNKGMQVSVKNVGLPRGY